MTTFDDDDDEAPPGAVPCTAATVLDYLTHPRGGDLSVDAARTAMVRHAWLLEEGERLRSFANYVGDQILHAEGWR